MGALHLVYEHWFITCCLICCPIVSVGISVAIARLKW